MWPVSQASDATRRGCRTCRSLQQAPGAVSSSRQVRAGAAPVNMAAPLLSRVLVPAAVLPPPASAAVPMILWRTLLSLLPPVPASVTVPALRVTAARRRPAVWIAGPASIRAMLPVGGPRLLVGPAAPAGCRALLRAHPTPVWALLLAVIAAWGGWTSQRRGVHHACARACS